jgi:hypothetical protein
LVCTKYNIAFPTIWCCWLMLTNLNETPLW